MKYTIFTAILGGILLICCTGNEKNKAPGNNDSTDVVLEIPNSTMDKSALHYNNKNSLWTLADQPYSGYAVSYYQDSTLMEEISILNGKQESQAMHWYPSGNLRLIENYHKGKLHGEKKVWSSDGVLLSHLTYQLGKPNGEQKTWYPTGELHKKLTLNMGKEEGIQQAFRRNGALYANYEAKAGRIFGLKKTSLCFGLEDEIIQNEK